MAESTGANFRHYLHLSQSIPKWKEVWRNRVYTRFIHMYVLHIHVYAFVQFTRGWVCFSFSRSTRIYTGESITRLPPFPLRPSLFHSYTMSARINAQKFTCSRDRNAVGSTCTRCRRRRSLWYACTFLQERRERERETQWNTVGSCGLHFRRLYPAGTRDLLGLHAWCDGGQ